MSLEGWKAFFEIGGVVLLLLTFAFGAGALIVNNRLNAIQAKELGDFRIKFEGEQQKTALAQKEAAEAKQIAGGFEIAISSANQRAAEANAKAEEFRLAIAAANERAAQATLELARLKTPRTLNPEQQKRISGQLKPFAGTQFDIALNVEPEPQELLPRIENALNAAGWSEVDWKGGIGIAEINFTRKDHPQAGIVAVSGVIIQMHPEQIAELGQAAQALASALNAEGIAARAEGGLGVPNANPKAIHILIGRKPI